MKECIVNKQITDNLVVVNRSIKELSEVNLLLEKTINEIKENKPLTHFNSDIMLKRQLNIVKQSVKKCKNSVKKVSKSVNKNVKNVKNLYYWI